jgi:excisionase family DNA binding protein
MLPRTQEGTMRAPRERRFYSVAEAADALGVSPSTIWRWIRDRRLPAYRVGPRTIRIKPEDVEALLQPARPQDEEVSNDVAAADAERMQIWM